MYYLSTLFTDINSSLILFESTKDIEIETFMVFNYFSMFLLFLVIALCFLVPAVLTEIILLLQKLKCLLIAEAKKVNAQYNLKPYKPFCDSYLLLRFALFFQ